jgi:hypothetical protein
MHARFARDGVINRITTSHFREERRMCISRHQCAFISAIRRLLRFNCARALVLFASRATNSVNAGKAAAVDVITILLKSFGGI